MLRVAVSQLPKAFLHATLVAQLPPKEELRPRNENGEAPEPLVLGAPIDPRDYSGRNNWLSCCRTVVEASGSEVVVFPHVILCEGSTYLLYVNLNPYKGPDKLEGGEWLLEIFGSGEVEAGADTMEQDLEELVRKSWEEPPSDPPKPPRAERAAASRRKWLIEHGLLEPEPVDEEAEVEAPPPPEKNKKGKEAKGKGAPASPEEPVEDPAAKAARETKEYEEALQRAEQRTHANVRIAEFVRLHTKVDPVLDMEDPYVIAPDEPEGGHAEAEDEQRLDDEETAALSAARRALGMLGLQEVRKAELESSAARWEKVFEETEAAKEKNKALLEELARWREEHADKKMQFLEEREALRAKLELRMGRQAALKDIFRDSADTEALQKALEEAEEAGVGVWDGELVESVGMKVRFLEAVASLKVATEKPAEELLPDPTSREAFAKSLAEAKELCQKLRERKAPLPTDLGEDELFDKADELAKEPPEEPPDA